MNKILYIASLNTEKNKYDGERIKSTYIYDSLKRHTCVSLINFSNNRFFELAKLILKLIFYKSKYKKIIISKDPHGANIIYKILNFFGVNFSNVYYFEIGPFLFDRINNGSIKKETFFNNSTIVVETNSMKEDLESLGFKNLLVFPNFKIIPAKEYIIRKTYPQKILKLIYLSRIEEMKGIYDLVEVLKEINKKETKFTLDIFGMFMSKDDKDKLNELISNCKYIQYKGKIDLFEEENYSLLANYDLHVFPTKYSEGFPGTIIDFFIVKVPTISSEFRSAYDILNNTNSYIFPKNDSKALKNVLIEIYDNQRTLNEKIANIPDAGSKYSIKSFDEFLSINVLEK